MCSRKCCGDECIPGSVMLMNVFQEVLWWWVYSRKCCGNECVPRSVVVMKYCGKVCSRKRCSDECVPGSVVVMSIFQDMLWWCVCSRKLVYLFSPLRILYTPAWDPVVVVVLYRPAPQLWLLGLDTEWIIVPFYLNGMYRMAYLARVATVVWCVLLFA